MDRVEPRAQPVERGPRLGRVADGKLGVERQRFAVAGLRLRIASEVVVCTKDRSEDLALLLPSIQLQEAKPAVLVVDSSSDERSAELVSDFAQAYPAPVRYLRSSPGLVQQRMLAVAS